MKDPFAQRKDTIEDVRAVLLDLQGVLSYIVNFPGLAVPEDKNLRQKVASNVAMRVQEKAFTAAYNIGVIFLRIAKFLRRSGYSYVVIPFLGWLSALLQKQFLPLRNIQYLQFRTRLNMELIYCAEYANSAEF